MSNSSWFERPLYMVLLPLFLTTRIFASNTVRLDVSDYLLATLFYVAAVVVLRMIFVRFFADKSQGDAVLALFLVSFLIGGYFLPDSLSAFVWALGCLVLCGLLYKASALHKPVVSAINVFLCLLVALPAYNILPAIPHLLERGERIEVATSALGELPAANPDNSKTKRDIYYIVLDRYARGDQLKKIYGYDNEPFLQALEKRGFYVARKAYSNYQRTGHSVASSLNLGFLDHLSANGGDKSFDWVPLYHMLSDFRLNRFLQKEGYSFRFLGNWWEPTRNNRNANENFNNGAWSVANRVIFDESWFGRAARDFKITSYDRRYRQCNRAKSKFSLLQNTKKAGDTAGKPQFTFAHMLVPHPPFVVKADGSCMSIETAKKRTRAQNYIGQVKYANGQLLKTIDVLQNRPGPKPIIILQADEGPWPKPFARDEIEKLGRDVSGGVDWRTVTPDQLREKMGILNAVYMPGLGPDVLPENSTPVNNFRTVLREYFGAPLARLEDKSFVFESNRRIYKFHDVTQKLQQPARLAAR
ncbi:MAG: LTA synthase family protein [Hyphomicrobiaceae bacterium]|nr:LTA synthase family protein [Hyphomicrobiaceae bacterium]